MDATPTPEDVNAGSGLNHAEPIPEVAPLVEVFDLPLSPIIASIWASSAHLKIPLKDSRALSVRLGTGPTVTLGLIGGDPEYQEQIIEALHLSPAALTYREALTESLILELASDPTATAREVRREERS